MSLFPVLYNSCYGGFGYSTKAIEENNKRLPVGSSQIDAGRGQGMFSQLLVYGEEGKTGPNQAVEKYAWDIERHDPLMVQVCLDLGDEASGEHAKISIKQVPTKFKKHYFIGEYDGLESVNIDFKKYQLDKIKCIVNDDSISSTMQAKLTREVLLEVKDDEDEDAVDDSEDDEDEDAVDSE